MDNWTTFGKEKKIKSMCNDKLVLVAPVDTTSIVPLFCSCCSFPMKNSEDSISYRKHGVCDNCDSRWTNKPGVSWPKGPDKLLKEWDEYIKYRIITSRPVIIFK